ncbi:MAG: hypothetical protein PHS14_02775 [Elusimicrobia bacterium]|nr:hypothetical protein [Elusimicrobiota bacterium]
MSRRLPSLALASFFLIVGTLASACPACDLPPASAPVSDPAPQAVFEAAAPGALLPEERDWLLAFEGGRYSQVSGRLADRKAPVAANHLLTNSAAWTLLGRRASERTAFLRGLAKDGRLPEEAREEAVALFWLRGTLVSPEDQAFLREASRPKSKPEPGAGSLEAGAQNAEAAPPPGGAAPAAGNAAQTAELLRNLRSSLDIAPDADPRAAAAMNQALESLVNTPTGRELALEFTASGARAKLEFGDVDNSATVVLNGRRILRASGGHTDTFANPPVVTLNRQYLDTDPDFRRVNMAATLGHEMFGHALEIQRAKKAGVSHDAVYYYRGDEAGSGLIGWLVQAELGGRLDNGHMWNYLADPEKYHAGLKTNLPYYSTTLSTAEMRVPVATLEGRVAAIEKDRKRTNEYAASMVSWRPVIEHFVTVHGMDREPFSSLSDDIVSAVIWSNSHQKDLDDINAHLTGTIKQWKAPAAAALKAELAAASGSAYMRQSEERLAARADRLRGLVAGRKPEPTVPPVPGKLTWDDLYRLRDQDRKDNPRHLEKIK